MLHEDMKHFYESFPRDAHPMATLASAVSTLSTFTMQEKLGRCPAKTTCIRTA